MEIGKDHRIAKSISKKSKLKKSNVQNMLRLSVNHFSSNKHEFGID